MDLKEKVIELEKELIKLKYRYGLTRWSVFINSITILILVLKVFNIF